MRPEDLPAGPILLDTSAFSIVWRGGKNAEPFLPYLTGRLLVLSFVTVGEVLAGMLAAQWGERKMSEFEERLKAYEVVPGTVRVARAYARITVALKRAGTPVEQNDKWIAACALGATTPLPILTADRDFVHVSTAIPELTVVRVDAESSA